MPTTVGQNTQKVLVTTVQTRSHPCTLSLRKPAHGSRGSCLGEPSKARDSLYEVGPQDVELLSTLPEPYESVCHPSWLHTLENLPGSVEVLRPTWCILGFSQSSQQRPKAVLQWQNRLQCPSTSPAYWDMFQMILEKSLANLWVYSKSRPAFRNLTARKPKAELLSFSEPFQATERPQAC